MVVVMEVGADELKIQGVIQVLNDFGFDVHQSSGVNQTVLGAVGVKQDFDIRHIQVLDGVSDVFRVTEPYKFASRSWKKTDTIVDVGGVQIGGEEVIIIAGPCSIESEEQMDQTAASIAAAGATILRGGAYKPRSSPYSFQGMGAEGLKIIRAAADKYNLKVVTEVMEIAHLDAVCESADLL